MWLPVCLLVTDSRRFKLSGWFVHMMSNASFKTLPLSFSLTLEREGDAPESQTKPARGEPDSCGIYYERCRCLFPFSFSPFLIPWAVSHSLARPVSHTVSIVFFFYLSLRTLPLHARNFLTNKNNNNNSKRYPRTSPSDAKHKKQQGWPTMQHLAAIAGEDAKTLSFLQTVIWSMSVTAKISAATDGRKLILWVEESQSVFERLHQT